MSRTICVRLAVCALVLGAMTGPVHADEIGLAGPIVGLELNTDDSDVYGSYRGKVFINEGDLVREYWWQGMVCAGLEPTVDQQEALADAVGKKVLIIPYYQVGGAMTRCLVGFGISTKKFLPDVAR